VNWLSWRPLRLEIPMRKTLTCALAGTLGLLPAIALSADDLNALRQQIEQLKQEYESRIQNLERRLEQTAQAQAAPTPAPSPVAGGVQAPGLTPLPLNNSASNAGNAFNPAMSIILDGAYYHDNQAGAGASRADSLDGIHHAHADAGEATHAHAHGGVEQGFNLRGAEMAVSASVDPYFDARAQIVFSEDAVAVEEAYFRSRSLPAGLQLKGGKFLSGIGYANEQHPHQWDFTDQNLVYQVFARLAGLYPFWFGNVPGPERENGRVGGGTSLQLCRRRTGGAAGRGKSRAAFVDGFCQILARFGL